LLSLPSSAIKGRNSPFTGEQKGNAFNRQVYICCYDFYIEVEMKVLFIHISKNWQGRVYPEYPLGVGLIATLSKQAGYDVHLHDMAVDDTPVEYVIEQQKPDAIALSFLSTSATMAHKTISHIKTFYDGIIISGGIHTSIFPQHVLRMGADVAVVGEGEPVIINLLDSISKLTSTSIPKNYLHDIQNIYYKNSQGNIEKTFSTTDSVDVNKLPPVDRDIFDLKKYPHHSIITSRGCPYRCKFCCAWGPGGRQGRMASPKRILDELEMLVNQYGPMTMYWADDMFFFNQAKRLEFCRLMKERQLPIKWIAQLRADNLTPELVSALKEAGCEKVCLGAESGSNVILKSVDKGLTRKNIENGIKCAISGGLRVKTWWIIGLPGGTYNEQLESIDLIAETRPHEVAVHTFVPLPGTDYWENAQKYGINLPSVDNLENLYYYGSPDDIKLDYLSADNMKSLISTYDSELQKLGYTPTDQAKNDTKYIYTSPSLKKTFEV
jgi:radical SAM superfamily enzyme YgiQ (UPF0313 family)